MKHDNDGIIICTGLIGGMLMSYGYLNEHDLFTASGIALLTFMAAVIFGAAHQNTVQKTEVDVDVLYTNIINIPKPNIELRSGDCTMGMVLPFIEKKDIIHRLKWWMFCKVFPFRYEWIESEDNQ